MRLSALPGAGKHYKKHPRPQPRVSGLSKPRSLSPTVRRKKIQSFSQATCAGEKIPLGLQTCELAARGGQRVRCSQAANHLSKRNTFLQSRHPRRSLGCRDIPSSDGHGQRVCNFLHDGLRLILLADAKDLRSQFQSAIQHIPLPLSSDFRRRPTQQTAPDGWYCRLQVIL